MNIRTRLLLIAAMVATATPVSAGVPSQADIKLTKVVDASKLPTQVRGYQIPSDKSILLVFYDPNAPAGKLATSMFLGNEKQLFEVVVTEDYEAEPRPATLGDWAARTLAPRSKWHFEFGVGYLKSAAGKTILGCGKEAEDLELNPLSEKAVNAVIAKAKFRTTALLRVPVALSRDDAGVYYYVDRLHNDLGGEGFRVFVGKRGAMKLLPLVDVANDNAGMVFATGKGDLRLTVNKEKPNEPATTVWANKKTTVTLRNVGVDRSSWYLIYRDLGVYGAMGALCEDR
ncbi:MAG TPA: hypothetical protein PLF40_01915 [Kofleriaceae bacterium]|nr:hypothetical protein [Kofleriaceae bacterium]